MVCTTGTISASDIVRLNANVDAVNDWAEGGAAFVATMASGLKVPSPLKVITDARLFKAPTAFSAAVTYTDATQPVTESGTVFAPLPDSLPIGPAVFNSAEWYVLQGVTEQEVAVQDITTHNMSSDADYTLTNAQSVNAVVRILDSGVLLTAARNIIVPDAAREWTVDNQTLQTLTFKTLAGAGVAVSAGDTQQIYSDGTNVKTQVTPSPRDKRSGVLFATLAATKAAGPVSLDGVVVDLVAGMRFSINGRPSPYEVVSGTALTLDDGAAFALANGTFAVAQFDGASSLLQWAPDQTAVIDQSTEIQAAMDSDFDLRIPPYQFRCVDVVLKKGKSITWDEGASFKPIGVSGTFVFKIDGSIAPEEESAIRVNINRIEIDGGVRAFAIDGLHLQSILRSEICVIVVNRLDGTPIDFVNSVKELSIDTIRLHDCGSTTSVGDFQPGLDLRETLLTGDAHNNIFIDKLYSVFSRGPDFVVDSANGRTTDPRKIHVNNYMIHGHIEASDPIGAPLTTPEKDVRKQIIIGSSDDIHFGTGSVQFAALQTHAIHLTAGANGPAVRTYFDHLIMNNRYDFAGASTQGTGIRQEAGGTLVINGIDIGNGYTGFDAIFSAATASTFINPMDFNLTTGSINLADANTIFSRQMDWDFGGRNLKNVGDIIGGSAELEIREGQSGSDRKGLGVRNGTALSRAISTNFGVFAFSVFSYPTKADLISDSIASAILTDGTTLRFFDGTDYFTLDKTIVP